MLIARDLRKHFPVKGSGGKSVQAVDGVSFTVGKGETLGVVGESGCGKSTLARLLLHLIKPDTGELVFDGDPVGVAAGIAVDALRRQVQMVFQDSYSSLNPRMPVRDSRRLRPLRARQEKGRGARTSPATCSAKVGLDPGPVRPALSARAVGRPEAAGQHRPRPGHRAAHGDPRRAGVGARQIGRGAGAEPAARISSDSST